MYLVTLFFSHWGHIHCVPFSVSQSSTCLIFFAFLGLFCCLLKYFFLHLYPDLVLPRCLLSPSRDRIPTAMGPAGKLLNVCQGDRNIEDYARDFVGVARQLATEKTCLMIIFWGGLVELFKSRMTYWFPEELLEDYINLALNLSGSAFRVELAAEPASVREPMESAAEPAPVREPTESTLESAPVREPTGSAPEPALVWEPMESAKEPTPVREPTESGPGAHGVRHRAWFGPGAHRVRSRACSHSSRGRSARSHSSRGGGAHSHRYRGGGARAAAPVHTAPEAAVPTHTAPESAASAYDFHKEAASAYKAPEAAAVSAYGPPALPALPWHLCLPLSPGPLPLHGPVGLHKSMEQMKKRSGVG